MKSDYLDGLDAAVRRRPLRPRALSEEAGYGLTVEPPVRRPKESESYWNIRVLTYRILGASYRIPQMNMYLLEDYVNERRGGKYFITRSSYVAPGVDNMRFYTPNGRVDFYAREEIDPEYFLSRFGLG